MFHCDIAPELKALIRLLSALAAIVLMHIEELH